MTDMTALEYFALLATRPSCTGEHAGLVLAHCPGCQWDVEHATETTAYLFSQPPVDDDEPDYDDAAFGYTPGEDACPVARRILENDAFLSDADVSALLAQHKGHCR